MNGFILLFQVTPSDLMCDDVDSDDEPLITKKFPKKATKVSNDDFLLYFNSRRSYESIKVSF